ncbi:MAG: hypothetical protein ACTS2F_07015 [Thainema sp.]
MSSDFQMFSALQPVSDELKSRLEQELRKPSAEDRRDDVADLMNSENFVAGYDACVWWDGCYYCRDANGQWYQIRCGFY